MKRKPLPPALNKLRNQVMDHIGERTGCMVVADMGGSVIVFSRKKFVAVETINADGFMPYTSQKEVTVPVPVILIFDKRDGIDPRMLARYHALGGDSVLVKTLADASDALDRG